MWLLEIWFLNNLEQSMSMAKVTARGKFPYISNLSSWPSQSPLPSPHPWPCSHPWPSPQPCPSAHPRPSLCLQAINITSYSGDSGDSGRKIKVRLCATSQNPKNAGSWGLKPLFFGESTSEKWKFSASTFFFSLLRIFFASAYFFRFCGFNSPLDEKEQKEISPGIYLFFCYGNANSLGFGRNSTLQLENVSPHV